ncbi:Ribosomal protein S8e, partial [sediment metagenome]
MDRGSKFIETRVGERQIKMERARGGNFKVNLKSGQIANISDSKTGKAIKSKIITVTENVSNPHFVRRNVMT